MGCKGRRGQGTSATGDHAEELDPVPVLDFLGKPFTLKEGYSVEFDENWIINLQPMQELGEREGGVGKFVGLTVED